MTNDLAAFTLARLDDDEAYARNAFGEHNDAGPNWYEQWSGALNIGEAEDLVLTNDSQVSRFMERYDPARALREVESKRRMVQRHAACGSGSGYCDDGGHGWDDTPGGGCPDLADLARPYDIHPDFREEWRP